MEMRQIIERAIAFGRQHKSAQTGYFHYCHVAQEDQPHQTIPVVENMMYALALLRARHVDNINEVKELLEGLLHFQNKEELSLFAGNFPIYLHEYPICKDRFNGLHVSCIIYWILKQYPQGLGNELRAKLKEALQKGLSHAIKTHFDKAAPYHIAVKLASLALAGGDFLEIEEFKSFGRSTLDDLCHFEDKDAWYSPRLLGVMLSGLVMVYPSLKLSPWSRLWDHLSIMWHKETGSYVGPAVKEYQKGFEPECCLLDAFMCYYAGSFSKRALKPSLMHLEAVLVPESEDGFLSLDYPVVKEGICCGRNWLLYRDEKIAYSLLFAGSSNDPKGEYACKVVWGNMERVHTMAIQGGNSSLIKAEGKNCEIKLEFSLSETVEVEDREKCRDLILYFDVHEEMHFLNEGQKASTFRLQDTLVMQDAFCKMSLTFSLLSGEGKFLGHQMLGNRLSQLSCKGNARFDAYDWLLFIRTLGRSQDAKLGLTIKLELREN